MHNSPVVAHILYLECFTSYSFQVMCEGKEESTKENEQNRNFHFDVPYFLE